MVIIIFKDDYSKVMNESEVDVALICKNCQHQISLHTPNCTTLLDGDGDVCNCNKPEFYNVVISGKYIGWTEIHCNNCGKLVEYIDSTIEILRILK